MKKSRIETPEQIQIRHQKENQEIARWERVKAKPKVPFAFLYTVIILVLIYVTDEVTTLIGTQMQAEIAAVLFNGELSVMTLLATISLPLLALSIFYKALSDRYGRKLFLVINTFGMGAGLFLVYLAGALTTQSGGVLFYVLGVCFINFFVPNDIQAIYIMETADPKRRATTYAIIKAIATLGVVLIPVMRDAFMGNDATLWHNVYIVPMGVAIVSATICMVFIRESDVFINKRLSFLRMTDEQRAAAANEASKEAESQGGIKDAFKFAFSHKQLKWLFISGLIYGLASMATSYYSAIASAYYSVENVTKVLFTFSFANAFMVLMNGLVGDRMGRKFISLVLCGVAFVCFILFYVGCRLTWDPYLVGLFIGGYVGGYYAAGDTMGAIMIAESTPTNLRASTTSAAVVLKVLGSMAAAIIPMIALFIVDNDYGVLGIICAVFCAPSMAIVLFLLFTKVGETKGIDLNTVTGEEWNTKEKAGI